MVFERKYLVSTHLHRKDESHSFELPKALPQVQSENGASASPRPMYPVPLLDRQLPRICIDENTTDIQFLKGQNQKQLPPFPDLSLTDLKTLQVDVSSNAQTES